MSPSRQRLALYLGMGYKQLSKFEQEIVEYAELIEQQKGIKKMWEEINRLIGK